MPTKEPKIKEHPPRMRKTLWIKMMSTTKIPNVSFVAANVQSINEDRKRASLFSNLRAHNADIFLLSETGRPPPERVAQWIRSAKTRSYPLFSLLSTILPYSGKSDSPVVTIDPESPSNFLRASFSFPDRISDATFRVGDLKVRSCIILRPILR
ncbi:BQ2448_26 [Microbotryum intermedium]|uniref:BQ2448_26 protein n=1 Tax=Microbotryum intermedium TaxID=269621 RepID=A0A238FGE6_9BASI|nr:BQ2448_26 [Microbotryum intermedium]